MPRYAIVTFDCYGTLIDWESGIAAAFSAAAQRDGAQIDRAAVLRAYAAQEPLAEQPPYRSYREVLALTAQRVAESIGWRLTDATFLAESLASWMPFPDTNSALERLRDAGYRLGILSNIDDDLLAATRRHLTVDFDLVVTARQVRSYKPRHAHFVEVRKRIGGAPWLHAAESNFHDIVPANALGIDNAWINRRGAARLPGGVPTLGEFPDLAALAEAMG